MNNVPYNLKPVKLFHEYIECLEQNCGKKKLKAIEKELKALGYRIIIPEEQKKSTAYNSQKKHFCCLWSIYLVDVKFQVVNRSLEVAVNTSTSPKKDTAPKSVQRPTQSPKDIFDRSDLKFLEQLHISSHS